MHSQIVGEQERELKGHLEASGWLPEHMQQLSSVIGHSALLSAEKALEVVRITQEAEEAARAADKAEEVFNPDSQQQVMVYGLTADEIAAAGWNQLVPHEFVPGE